MTVLLALLGFCLSATAQNLRPQLSGTLELLQAEGAKDPAGLPKAENAKTETAETFTGENPLPFHVTVLSPVELIDPAAPRRERPAQETAPAPEAPKPVEGDEDDDRPSYHFEGRSPMGGLTLYTPVQDRAGRDNSTRASGPGGLMGMLKGLFKWAAIAVGVLLVATSGPVGIGIGAALIAGGAWMALKKD